MKRNYAAIAGAGFSGLAVCFYLLQKGWEVDLYDPKPIGTGTSGIAAGLLNPFAGESAKQSKDADEGISATLELIAVAESELSCPVRTYGGIIRRAMNPRQELVYAACAAKYPDKAEWKGTELWVKEGFAVHTELYLKGLWKFCQRNGARFHQTQLPDSDEQRLVVWATGADMADQSSLVQKGATVSKVRGQLLEIAWPSSHPPLSLPLSSKMYAVMNVGGKSCTVGSTYERGRFDDIPDVEFAREEILPKVIALLPELDGMPILNCRAGVRASTPTHLPFAKRIDDHCYAIGGMGSKGLLYHALYARKLVDNIMEV